MPDDESPNAALRDQFGALRSEIESIGRIQRSVEPGGLIGYDLLLSCPATSSLVDVDQPITRSSRAYAAHLALKAAIASLGADDGIQLVGQAVLGIGEFEGKLVEQRQTVLQDKFGLDKDSYKRRRAKVLNSIVMSLLFPVEKNDNEVFIRRGVPARHRRAIEGLTALFGHLHSFSMGLQAVIGTRAIASVLDRSVLDHSVSRDEGLLTETVVRMYLDLLLSSAACFRLDQPVGVKVRALLPADLYYKVRARLSALHSTYDIFSSDFRESAIESMLNPADELRRTDRLLDHVVEQWRLWLGEDGTPDSLPYRVVATECELIANSFRDYIEAVGWRLPDSNRLVILMQTGLGLDDACRIPADPPDALIPVPSEFDPSITVSDVLSNVFHGHRPLSYRPQLATDPFDPYGL